jgi:outer membrane protein OmpA-like peptidoglycan-associated protein
MFRFCLLTLLCLLSNDAFARVIIVEHNPKASIEINISVLQEFREISKNKKTLAVVTPKAIPEAKISSKSLSFVQNQKISNVPSEIRRAEPKITTVTNIEKTKPQLSKEQVISDEVKIKKANEEKRLVEVKAKEDLIKKAAADQEKQNKIIAQKEELPDPKLSRAKNLLRKVEKSLLKTKSKNKEYNIDSEVNKVNLANIHVKKLDIQPDPVKTIPQKFVIKFPKNVNDIKSTMNEELNKIVAILTSNQDKRVRIIGYSSGDNKSSDIATRRRNALEKVVAVRKYFVDRGVNTRQVSLQAAGDSTSKADMDRVEVMEIGL